MIDLPEISTAYELRPGAVYAIQCDRLLTAAQRSALKEVFDATLKKHSIEFIVLEGGLRLVEPPR